MKSKTKRLLVMSQLREIDLLNRTKNTNVINEIRSDLLTRYGVRLDFDTSYWATILLSYVFRWGYADPLDKDMMPEPMIWLVQGDGYKGFEPRYGIMIPRFPICGYKYHTVTSTTSTSRITRIWAATG